MARCNTNGSLDPTFGIGGKVRTSFGDLNGGAYGAVLQPDGKIVAVGFNATQESVGVDFALARYLGSSGSATPTPTPAPTPTATPSVSIAGTVLYCSNPVPGPVPNVTMTLTGATSGSTLTDGSGNYLFTGLSSGGNYTVTPSKAARVPGSANINTVDVIATQRHFLNIGTPLAGCRLMAADVNGDTSVNTVDVIAIQRFFLGLTTGTANVGKYKFTPVNRTYTGLVSNQTAQNYDTLILGDVATPFVEPTAAEGGRSNPED